MKEINKDRQKEQKLLIKAYKGIGVLETKLECEQPRELTYHCTICKYSYGMSFPTKTREEAIHHCKIFHTDLHRLTQNFLRALDLITNKDDIASYRAAVFKKWKFFTRHLKDDNEGIWRLY